MVEIGCLLDPDVCELAALGGHLDVLVWLRGRGWRCQEATFEYSARGGHMRVVE